MKLKIFSLLLSLIAFASLFILPVRASASVELPIDVNERYTDINYRDETNVYGEVVTEEEQQELETKKTVYIVILSILFVVSIVILIVTVKRAKEDKLFTEEEVSGTRD